ncbi:MAG: ATP-binding cassette domain-containing protein [Verrucomicrobiota bacterium]
MPNQTNLRLIDVSKRYASGRAVLDSLSLDIASGDIVALIGPRGCGKSTILRLIAGLTPLTAGEIEYPDPEGRPAYATPSAFVFSEAALLPWRTVRRNILLPLQLAGIDRNEQDARANAMMKLWDISHIAQRFPVQLTPGNRMRAAFARAMITEPNCLLMDEPFAGLDAITRNKLSAELMKVRSKQTFSACLVTHSAAEAVFMANRIVVLSANPGKIKEIIEVEKDFPRKLAWRESNEFQEAVTRVRSTLNESQEGVAS